MYNCRWRSGKSIWTAIQGVLDLVELDDKAEPAPFPAPQWEHSDHVIHKPTKHSTIPEHLNLTTKAIIYFDGGNAEKLGTIGYAAFLPEGCLWFGRGEILADKCSNIEAEFRAAIAALSTLLKSAIPLYITGIIVVGDC